VPDAEVMLGVGEQRLVGRDSPDAWYVSARLARASRVTGWAAPSSRAESATVRSYRPIASAGRPAD
jgi:hypothetical protein